MATQTENGRPVKLLTIVDEYTRECLAIQVARRLRSDDVLFRLAELFVQHEVPPAGTLRQFVPLLRNHPSFQH